MMGSRILYTVSYACMNWLNFFWREWMPQWGNSVEQEPATIEDRIQAQVASEHNRVQPIQFKKREREKKKRGGGK